MPINMEIISYLLMPLPRKTKIDPLKNKEILVLICEGKFLKNLILLFL